jgi:Spy/CpxP family protein refolding chaperone
MQGTKNLAMMFLLGATLVGGALGFAADRYMVRDRLCNPKLSERELRVGFYDDVGLTAEQRAAWDALLDERQKSMTAARATIKPKTDSIMEAYRQKTTELLSPEQRARVDQWRAADRERQGRPGNDRK